MTPGDRLRAVHAAAGPLISPLAHDALSARMIARAGFQSFNIGGSTLLAARYGLPDLGIAALGDMVAAIRDVVEAVPIPCMADADDGYGDLKSVARTVQSYERMGVAGLLLEDQGRDGKQPGASTARAVVPLADMERKLRTALAAREDGIVVIGRTDAIGLEGIDGALRRAERFLEIGADGVFVAGLRSEEEFRRVGAAFKGRWNAGVMFEGGATPWFSPRDLHAMGFSQISYPMSLMLRVVDALEQALDGLRALADGTVTRIATGNALAAESFRAAVEIDRWTALETGTMGQDGTK